MNLSREIKFRAWDKEAEKMFYSDKVPCDYDFAINKNGNLVCAVNCCYCDTFGDEHDDWNELDNIMQYTGLKDKHGKEIYEGDIVTDGAYNYTVVFYGGAWVARLDCESGSYHSLYPASVNREVIGNIYENAELLKS